MIKDAPHVGAIGARPVNTPERDPLRTMASILNMVRIPPRPQHKQEDDE